MDELIDLVVKKAGISEAQARKAVETVVDFLKDKLPGPLAGQVEKLLEGGGASNLTSGLGGLLGGKK